MKSIFNKVLIALLAVSFSFVSVPAKAHGGAGAFIAGAAVGLAAAAVITRPSYPMYGGGYPQPAYPQPTYGFYNQGSSWFPQQSYNSMPYGYQQPMYAPQPYVQPVYVQPVQIRQPIVDNSTQAGEFAAYPAKGQSRGQQIKDREQCERWAETQDSATTSTRLFNRAVAACMQGRGYTVR